MAGAVEAYLEGLGPGRRERAIAALRRVCELALRAGGVLENLGSTVPWPYLRRMMEAGILHEYYRSHRYRMYQLLVSPEEVLARLDELCRGGEEGRVELPGDLFEDIVGHDDVKWLLRRLLTSERPFHVLLIGEPATAKTFFLMELERVPVPKVVVLGSSLSKAGLLELVREARPRLILIDELDKVERPRDLAALLSLMESGRAVKAVKGEHWEVRLDVRVVAAANDASRLDRALLDRFIPVRFPRYTEEEYMRVATAVLTRREGLSEEEARLVAREAYRRGMSVRQAVLIARASGGGRMLGEVLRVLDRGR